jgi:hypothetical protein
MNSIRQFGSGLFYAVVSVVLVVGGLSLALSEGRTNLTPPAKPTPTLLLPSPTATAVVLPSSVTPAAVISPPAPLTPSATPPARIVTATPTRYLATASMQPRATSTHVAFPTHFDCGPYSGWLRNYIVKPGDTLFHIATLYQTTVTALQVANCKLNFTIFPGEVLWVPNVPTITPGVTMIPTFPSSTAVPTLPLTATPLPYNTETAVPTLPLTATP